MFRALRIISRAENKSYLYENEGNSTGFKADFLYFLSHRGEFDIKCKEKTMAKYDIIIQNSASKQVYVLSGLTPTEETGLYVQFEDVELPSEAKNGEYTYVLVQNRLSGVTYAPKTDVLDTIVTYSGQSYTLRDLRPMTGLMRVGEVNEKNVYQPKDKNKTYYYQK